MKTKEQIQELMQEYEEKFEWFEYEEPVYKTSIKILEWVLSDD